MVINGRAFQGSDLAVAQFERERILLPARFAREARLAGTKPIECLLLVVTPGRYRLLLEPTATDGDDLPRLVDRINELGAPGDVLDGTENNSQAAIRAQLIPCIATPPPPGWRINFPKAAKQLVPQKQERSFVFVFTVAGRVEIWFPDTLRQAMSEPISERLP